MNIYCGLVNNELNPDLFFQIFEILRNTTVGSSELVATFLDRTLELCRNDFTDLTRLAIRFISSDHFPILTSFCLTFHTILILGSN